MSGLLLDTHVIVWMLDDSPRLGRRTRSLISSASSVKYSPASLWELRIKELKGRIELPPELAQLLRAAGLVELPITSEGALGIQTSDTLHGDPFGRMISSQARRNTLTLVTADQLLLNDALATTIDARL